MKRYFAGTVVRQYWWEAIYMRVRFAFARRFRKPAKDWVPEKLVSYKFKYSARVSPNAFRKVR